LSESACRFTQRELPGGIADDDYLAQIFDLFVAENAQRIPREFYANQVDASGPSRMSDTRIDFSAPATLRKWPSVNKERVTNLGARPYMVIEGTLDECIQNFMSRPESQRHLYEIQTAPQSDLVSATLLAEQIAELARLKDFL
jgi:hypothetical protein